jgi:ribosome biogenesis GTPase
VADILRSWGWSRELESETKEIKIDQPELLRARVIGEEKGFLRIICEDEKLIWARYKKQARQPAAVGDWILGVHQPGTDRLLLEYVLRRQSWIARRMAGGASRAQILGANLDLVFIVSSLNADFNPKRIERYVALAKEGSVKPVVILSKSDLIEGKEVEFEKQLEFLKPSVEVFSCSLKTGAGLDLFESYLKEGISVGFLGSSGVGKSSLVNYLLTQDQQKTADIRDDDRGRHTTSSRMMFFVPHRRICVLDTPGLREVGLWLEEKSLEELFLDIFDLARRCKFSDCRHENEPQCAIQEALQDKNLSHERWQSFQKMKEERDLSQAINSPVTTPAKKRQLKKILETLRSKK